MSTQMPEISKGAREFYVRSGHEILFGVYDYIIHSEHTEAKAALEVLKKEELYNHLQYHQKLIITLLHFQNHTVMLDNFAWIIKRMHHRELPQSFFKYELSLWQRVCNTYIGSPFYGEIEALYDYILEHFEYMSSTHTQIKRLKYESLDEKLIYTYKLLQNGEYEAVKAIAMKEVDDLDTLNKFLINTIEPIMVRVGLDWEEGIVSVAKEHMISALVGDLMVELFSTFAPCEIKNGLPSVLVATAPKELHALGAKTISKMLEYNGFKSAYLGSDLSQDEIFNAVVEMQPDVLVLSVTLEVHVVEIQSLIKRLKEPPYEFRGGILVGGRAFVNLQNAQEQLNVDGICFTPEELLMRLKGL
jgi:methanogenic corrinoid protein MtbC1